MYYCSLNDVFLFKGQLATCIYKEKTQVMIRTGTQIRTMPVDSLEFQDNVQPVNTIVYIYEEHINVPHIFKIVCEYFNLPTHFVTGRTRKAEYVNARHIGIYLSLKFTKCSLDEVGKFYGGRDHSTAIHARDKVTDLLQSGDYIVEDVNQLCGLITRVIKDNKIKIAV